MNERGPAQAEVAGATRRELPISRRSSTSATLIVEVRNDLSDDADDIDEIEESELRALADDLGFVFDEIEQSRENRDRATPHETAAIETTDTMFGQLFDHVFNCVAYCRAIYDGDKPVDWEYLRVNAAFERETGVSGVSGKRASELFPSLLSDDPRLTEIYGRVAQTGTPERFEMYVRSLDMWLSVAVYSTERDHFVAIFDVITEKRKAEAALKLQTSALQAAANGIVIADREGKILWTNAAFTVLTGYGSTSVVGRKLDELEPDCQRNEQETTLRATVSSGGVWRGELTRRRPDGSTYDEEMTVTPVLGELGQVTHLVAIKQDISERKRAEAILRGAQERQDIALEATDLGTWSQDVLTGVVTLDERARRHFDIDQSPCSADGLLSQCHPDDVDRVARILAGARNARSEGRVQIDHRIIRRDGTLCWVSNHVKALIGPANDGQVQALVATSRDVSEAKAAEERLRLSEERYRLLVDNIDGLVFSTDLEGRITFVNRAIERYGYKVEHVVGRMRDEFMHPDDIDKARRSRDDQWSAGEFHPIEYRIVDSAGNPRYVRSTMRPLRLGGEWVGTTGVVLDVTAQRETEEQLRAAQKMEAVGRLAGGVAHDFNNLLSVILSYTELAVAELHENDPLRADLEEVVRAARRAEALTKQLLAFSRHQILRPEPIAPAAAVQALGKMLRRLIGEDIELSLDTPDGLYTILADRGQIEQVLMNLIVNARDAMPDGGRVDVSLENRSFDETASERLDLKPGDYVEIAVSDTGCGMDAPTLARIYEPFFTTKGQGKGTGLGLSMVYGILRQSGGAIMAESVVGRGATFHIYLPRYVHAEVESRTSPSVLPPGRGHETILVVEDETALRHLVTRVLTAVGYKVLSASNAGEALLYCEKHGGAIHLVLTDVVMPGMNGKDLVARVTPLCPKARFMFMSGYTSEVLERHGIERLSFLAKPFDLQTLTAKVRDTLDRAE